jgi:thioredoxin 1
LERPSEIRAGEQPGYRPDGVTGCPRFPNVEATINEKRNMKLIVELNETNFEAEVLKSGQPVLVDFWAEWCGPCKMLAPVLEEIATEQAGRVKVAKVNVDENPGLAAQYQIQSIPTLLYFAGGEVRDKSVGVQGRKAISLKLEALAVAA